MNRPLTPSLSPSGEEGARRAGEGVVQGFKARNWFRRILSPEPPPPSAGGEGEDTGALNTYSCLRYAVHGGERSTVRPAS